LPPVIVSAEMSARIRQTLPELPAARVDRFVTEHGLSEYDANVIGRLLPGGAAYFEAVVAAGAPAKAAGNWIQGEVRRKLKDIGAEDLTHVQISADDMAGLVQITERGVISSTVAKDVFEKMWGTGRLAQAIVDEEG